jgi:hypothetical protein
VEVVADQFFTPFYNVGYNESAWQAQSIEDATQVCSRRLQVEGRFAQTFVKEMLGWTTFDAGGGTLQRHPPAAHPRFWWLYARSAQFVRELGPNDNTGPDHTLNFSLEEWEVTYRADEDRLVNWARDDQKPVGAGDEHWRYVSRQYTQSVTIQPLPLGYLYYNKPVIKQDGTLDYVVVPDGQSGQLIPSRSRTLVWYQIPITLGPTGMQLPGRLQQTIDETLGCINGTAFEGVPAENLLLCDVSYKQRVQSDGSPVADLVYSLIQRGGTADVSAPALYEVETDTGSFTRLLRANGKYGRVFRKDDPTRVRSIYELRDLNRLFQFS